MSPTLSGERRANPYRYNEPEIWENVKHPELEAKLRASYEGVIYVSGPSMTKAELMAERTKEEMTWAEIALARYNAKEDANFKPVKTRGVGVTTGRPIYCVHLCFEGTNTAGVTKLFFAQLLVPRRNQKELEIKVTGCCVLKKVKADKSNTKQCSICRLRTPHPLPSYGYCRESGDIDVKFANGGGGEF